MGNLFRPMSHIAVTIPLLCGCGCAVSNSPDSRDTQLILAYTMTATAFDGRTSYYVFHVKRSSEPSYVGSTFYLLETKATASRNMRDGTLWACHVPSSNLDFHPVNVDGGALFYRDDSPAVTLTPIER
jgi:hypothetical protein